MNGNLDQLREVADKIKGLAWELDGFSDGDDYVRLELYGDEARSQVIASSINNIDHAHYLNAVRPSTVLALIDRVEAAEQAVERAKAVDALQRRDKGALYRRAEVAEGRLSAVGVVVDDLHATSAISQDAADQLTDALEGKNTP